MVRRTRRGLHFWLWRQRGSQGHVSDVCSLSIPGRHGGGLYPLAALAAPSAAPVFFLHNSPAALAAGRATGSSSSAGRSRGKLMGLGRVLAPRFRAVHFYPLAWAAPSAAPDFFLHNSPAALAAGRAKGRSPTAGRSRGKLMGRDVLLALELRALGTDGKCVFDPLAALAAPSAAPVFFLQISPAALAARPSYGVIADRWPQPRQADGSRRSARSRFRAGTLMSLSVGACGAWAPRAALD